MRRAVVALLALALLAPAAAFAHQGNPRFLSQITRITPATTGLSVEVLNRDDRMLLRNTSGKDVLILGYEDEPYALLRADGTVAVNDDSPARYLNDDRFGEVAVAANADGKGEPRWRTIAANGRFEWHDHRFHWMTRGTPPQVEDESVRTRVMDWTVPIEVDGRRGAIAGTLFWTPLPGGGPPAGALVAGAGIVIALCLIVAVVRHRRRVVAERDPAAAEPEAW